MNDGCKHKNDSNDHKIMLDHDKMLLVVMMMVMMMTTVIMMAIDIAEMSNTFTVECNAAGDCNM